MKVRIRAILLVSMVVLGSLFVGWNFESVATSPTNDSGRTLNQSSEPRSNGGLNWSQIEVISEPIFGQNYNGDSSSNPRIAVENGEVYVVWQDSSDIDGAGTDSDIFYRYFDGNTWSKIQIISEPVADDNKNTGASFNPDIAVEDGNIYVVWHDRNDTHNAGTGDYDIFYRCNITGSSWEPIQVISEPVQNNNFNSGESWFPRLAVENSKIYVVWRDDSDLYGAGANSDIFYCCNLTSTKWETIQVISEPVPGNNFHTGWSYDPEIAVENDNIYVVWHDQNDTNGAGTDKDIFYRCNLTGSSWEQVQVISEPVPGNDFNIEGSWSPSIAVENSKIYVAWRDKNLTYGAGGDWDIFYRCNLSGLYWEKVQVISEPEVGKNYNSGDSSSPSIAIENDKIYVVWWDENITNNSGSDDDIFFRVNLTGSSWEKVQVISEPVVGYNYNTANSLIPNIVMDFGNIHVVWRDSNDTNGSSTDSDIFYRWMIQTPLSSLFLSSPRVNPLIGNTSTEFNFTITYYQLNNTPPTIVKVIIDGLEHLMLEVDPSDMNYKNGKKYFFKLKNFDIGKHTYEFNASDGINFTNTRVFSHLKVTNTLPRILTENKLTAVEDTYYETLYVFEDIDIANIGQVCAWEFSTNASWLNFDTAEAKLYGTPTDDDVGQYWINISVNDSIDIVDNNFTLIVLEIIYDPIINTNNVEIAYEDELYEVDYDATDIDNPIIDLIWSLETNASIWLGIDSFSGILKGTPGNDDVGGYWVNVSVDDGNKGSDWTEFELVVIDINDPPTILTDNITTVYEDELYSVDYNATDIDGDTTFEWHLKTNASWLSIEKTYGILFGTPQNEDVGISFVNITVKDTREGTSSQNFTLEVLNVNDPPKWVSEPKDTTLNEGEVFIFDVNATDMDVGDILNYSIGSDPITNITIDPATGLIEWSAYAEALDGAEVLKVIVTATDGDEYIFSYFDINVIPNSPPTVSLITPTNNELVSTMGVELKWEGDDKEDNPLVFDIYLSKDPYSVSHKDSSARIIQGTNSTSYFYEDIEVRGIYYWTVIPYDGFYYGKCLNGNINFVVNTPPSILPIPDQTMTAGTEFELEVKGSDQNEEDRSKLVYGLESAPEGMTINSLTGMLTWTPTEGQVRSHTVVVLASDGKDVTTTIFDIEVKEAKSEVSSSSSNQSFLNGVIILIVIIIIILILVIIIKKRKKQIIPDVEYIPPHDAKDMLSVGSTGKPGAISGSTVIIDQVAPEGQQTQMQPASTSASTAVPGQIPSIASPTATQTPMLPPAAVKTPKPESVSVPEPTVSTEETVPTPMPTPTPIPTPEPVPVPEVEPEPLVPAVEETAQVTDFGLEGGPTPVQKEGVEHDVVTERVVEEIDTGAATADLKAASVVELAEEEAVVHDADTSIWRPDDSGKVAENKEVLEQLEKLVELKDKGALTEEEFERKKKELLK
jgi:cell division protein FtsN